MLIECTYGPVTTEVAGTQYTFMPDEKGICVAEVWVPRHIQALLAVVHYRPYGAQKGLSLVSLEPAGAEIGSEDLVLICNGTNFLPDSVIYFNGGAETTNFISDTQLSTIVKPSLASVAGDFPVFVKGLGDAVTVSLPFSFTEAPPARTVKAAKSDKSDKADKEDFSSDPIPVTDIAGIGPALASRLAAEGITDARHIARLKRDEAAELDEKLGLSGRIARDEWVKQAKGLVR